MGRMGDSEQRTAARPRIKFIFTLSFIPAGRLPPTTADSPGVFPHAALPHHEGCALDILRHAAYTLHRRVSPAQHTLCLCTRHHVKNPPQVPLGTHHVETPRQSSEIRYPLRPPSTARSECNRTRTKFLADCKKEWLLCPINIRCSLLFLFISPAAKHQ